ncbi:MAG: acetylesterase [Planctomycetes bacterium]|nr:acetylesterase [Planctomycetota bacterium]
MRTKRVIVCVWMLLGVTAGDCALAQRKMPEIPDLTQGGQKDDLHDWNLGPTGARGWIWGWKLETTHSRQILVTDVDKGSPAEGKLQVGDVILGVGDRYFTRDARKAFGHAITEAEKTANRGMLTLLVWRHGETSTVTLKLQVMGSYSATSPYDCAKSQKILDAACRHIAANMTGSIQGTVNALALLASGKEAYAPMVRDFAHKIAPPDLKLDISTKNGMPAWTWGYNNIFVTEYYLATGDTYVLPAIKEYSVKLSMGQSGVGTWGHGMAWQDINGGKMHGSLGGYGAMNQPGLTCHMSLVLAKKCGIRHKEIDLAIDTANRYFSFYINKGAIPYGDHRPNWQWHDDNGKNSSGAIMFDLQGMDEGATFFSKMTVASYGEREKGHTGNYFSYLWGPLAANRAGPKAATAFLKEQQWFYDLARRWDGSFVYQGGAASKGGEHSYRGWDCTGEFILPAAMPLKRLYVTGKGTHKAVELSGTELTDVIEAGRGYTSWRNGLEVYEAKSVDELLVCLQSWSPAVRHRASVTLAKQKADVVPALIKMLGNDDLSARYGACQAITELKGKGAPAVDRLIELLGHDDVWLRIQSCYALAGIGQPARRAVPEMLKLAVRRDEQDPRQFTQRFLAFTLFYPGGALGNAGLVSRDLKGVDLGLLYPAVRIMLLNDDGRARSAVGSVYKNLTIEQLAPLLPEILAAIEVPCPSGIMFSSGIRLQGLDLLAKNKIKEGLPMCLKTMEIAKWGKKGRVSSCLKTLRSYGPAAAKTILPELRQLEKAMLKHSEARTVLKDSVKQVREIIEEAEQATGKPDFVPLNDFVNRKS